MIKNELTKTDLKTSDFYFDLPQELFLSTLTKSVMKPASWC